MKKIILASAMLALGATGAFAQRAGQFGVGVNMGVQPVIEGKDSPTNFLVGGRIQYSATNLIRLVLDLNGGCEDDHFSTFTATANANFMIPLAKGFYLYPTAGLGMGNIRYSDDGHTNNNSKFVFNIGLGGEYEFSKNWAAGLEFKYQYMKDYGALPVFLNVSYKF